MCYVFFPHNIRYIKLSRYFYVYMYKIYIVYKSLFIHLFVGLIWKTRNGFATHVELHAYNVDSIDINICVK